jgi:hypothetical protein
MAVDWYLRFSLSYRKSGRIPGAYPPPDFFLTLTPRIQMLSHYARLLNS